MRWCFVLLFFFALVSPTFAQGVRHRGVSVPALPPVLSEPQPATDVLAYVPQAAFDQRPVVASSGNVALAVWGSAEGGLRWRRIDADGLAIDPTPVPFTDDVRSQRAVMWDGRQFVITDGRDLVFVTEFGPVTKRVRIESSQIARAGSLFIQPISDRYLLLANIGGDIASFSLDRKGVVHARTVLGQGTSLFLASSGGSALAVWSAGAEVLSTLIDRNGHPRAAEPSALGRGALRAAIWTGSDYGVLLQDDTLIVRRVDPHGVPSDRIVVPHTYREDQVSSFAAWRAELRMRVYREQFSNPCVRNVYAERTVAIANGRVSIDPGLPVGDAVLRTGLLMFEEITTVSERNKVVFVSETRIDAVFSPNGERAGSTRIGLSRRGIRQEDPAVAMLHGKPFVATSEFDGNRSRVVYAYDGLTHYVPASDLTQFEPALASTGTYVVLQWQEGRYPETRTKFLRIDRLGRPIDETPQMIGDGQIASLACNANECAALWFGQGNWYLSRLFSGEPPVSIGKWWGGYVLAVADRFHIFLDSLDAIFGASFTDGKVGTPFFLGEGHPVPATDGISVLLVWGLHGRLVSLTGTTLAEFELPLTWPYNSPIRAVFDGRDYLILVPRSLLAVPDYSSDLFLIRVRRDGRLRDGVPLSVGQSRSHMSGAIASRGDGTSVIAYTHTDHRPLWWGATRIAVREIDNR